MIDAAHAALMTIGEIPPAPNQVGEMLRSKLVRQKIIEQEYADTVDKFYDISKKITHRDIKEISGKQFDILYKEADEFVQRMCLFIEKRK